MEIIAAVIVVIGIYVLEYVLEHTIVKKLDKIIELMEEDAARKEHEANMKEYSR